jgi:hypothetical protein
MGSSIVDRRVLDVQPANPVIDLCRQTRQLAARESKQRVHLVRRQHDPERETGSRRVHKELLEKAIVRQQPTQRSFHVALTHCPPPRSAAGKDHTRLEAPSPACFLTLGAIPHVDV